MKIFKYPLIITDIVRIPIKGLVEVLSVVVQHERLVLCAIVDPDSVKETEISVAIVGTGHEYKLNSSWNFLGTHLMANGALMWHVWWNFSDNLRAD